MTPTGQIPDPWYKSLRFKLAGLLSIALLPIGLIALIQTQSVARASRENVELALLALTQQAAAGERLALRQASGAADAIVSLMPTLLLNPERCSRYMRGFVDRSPKFSFAGFLPKDGQVTCSSAGRPYNVLDFLDGEELFNDPKPRIDVNMLGPISGVPVIVDRHPVFDSENNFLGYVSISIPQARLRLDAEGTLGGSFRTLITFNESGDVLTGEQDGRTVRSLLPEGIGGLADLARRVGERGLAMTARDGTGARRIYTVAPIEEGLVYALGIWDVKASPTDRFSGAMLTSLFPILMWAVSLLVCLFAVHRLVIRHLERLGRQMALFTAARRLPSNATDADPPTEILRIQKSFHRMTDALLRDEASLEKAVREKSVLVKEIHHRVKNNLQLISSIINLQIRNAESAEAKTVLRQTQERVLSMATIHRDLYQTNESGLVDVSHLLREVVSTSVEVSPGGERVDLRLEVDDIWLFPDQAVPMSLLASEAVINALKHMPGHDDDPATRWLDLSFTQGAHRVCTFRLSNALRPVDGPRPQSKGMGRKLIRAFATQLQAEVVSSSSNDTHILTVSFTASDFAPAPGSF